MTWNVALGKDIPNAANLPAQAGVPYLFTTLASGATASFGGRTVTAGNGQTLTVVFDPSDPSLYVQSNSGANFKAGASLQGNLKYKPSQSLAGVPAVFGNLLTNGVNPNQVGD